MLRAVKVPLEPHEFDALVSFHYNTGGIAKASLTRHLNAGNHAAVPPGFMGWLRPAAIRSRREAERNLFRDGRYPTGTAGGVVSSALASVALWRGWGRK